MSTQTRALALILLLGFVARLGFILVVPSVPLSDFADYDRLGWSLAEDRGYVNDSGQPTAFRAPGYPFMLSLIYRAFGHRTGIAKAVNAALGTLTCLLIFWMARLIGHEQIALLSALIYALYPSAVYYTNLLATEVPFTFLLFLAIFISLKVSTDPMGGQGRGPFVCSVLLLGAVLGSAALVKPVALSALGFLVISVVARLKPTKRALLFGFIILGTVLLFILPWSYRNYLVSKRWALVTHGGMSFYLGTIHGPPATTMSLQTTRWMGLRNGNWMMRGTGLGSSSSFDIHSRPCGSLCSSASNTSLSKGMPSIGISTLLRASARDCILRI